MNCREQDEDELVTAIRERVRSALTEHFRRNDTNNGKGYCLDCDANDRRDGSIKHKSDCAVSVALEAIGT
jgi:hypothetical protein